MALCPKIFLVECPNCVPNFMLLSSNPQSFHISAALHVRREETHITRWWLWNKTQMTSKDEMAWPTEDWHAHLWHQTSRAGHWQRMLVCPGEKHRHHLGGRRRKLCNAEFCNGAIPVWRVRVWRGPVGRVPLRRDASLARQTGIAP